MIAREEAEGEQDVSPEMLLAWEGDPGLDSG
jgi:hypothetical protein